MSDDMAGRVLANLLVSKRILFMIPKHDATIQHNVHVLVLVENDVATFLVDNLRVLEETLELSR